jgi:quercetin dioxygenase-like cupin family protein
MSAIVLDRDQAQTLPFGPHQGRVLSPDSGSYCVSEWTLVPGETAPPLHTHRYISESIYVVSGEVELLDGERSFIGTPGTFVHVPPGQLHGFGAILSAEPLRILMVQSPAEASAALLRAMSQAASCTDMAETMSILATVDMVPHTG